ncbi:cytochrome P450 [Bisporella sp. PMI_857]|nr:cytochrome P450 [Bisporella sp. PMI_857]
MAIYNIPTLALGGLLFLIVYKYIIHPTFLSPLSNIPNAHWSSPISPIWILWTRFRSRENRTLHASHLKHGSVIRVGPNEISINDISGGQWYSIFDNYGVPCMFSSWHSQTHSARKRFISNTYSKSNIHNSPALARQAQKNAGLDVLDLWNATTMDFICAYLFGLKNGSNFLQNETYRRHWLSLYHSRKTYPFFTQELPRLTKFFKKVGIHLVPTWDKDAGNEPVVLTALLAGIAKEEKLRGDTSALKATTLKYKEPSIASEMIDHLAAGHETSGITLTYLTWRLSTDQALQGRLRAELLALSPPMTASPSASQPLPSPKALDALPLLHAVLMETLRLHAAIPGGQPRMAPSPSSTISGHQIPGGVRVAAQAHSLHRNAAVFPSPESFDVDRWLDDSNGYSEEQKRERDRWFWAFSSGGRGLVDDEGIEQDDGYTVGPRSNKLTLKFEKVL